jgi:hypothetical protein
MAAPHIQPEQIGVDLRQQVLPLEALLSAQRVLVECLSLRTLRMQPLHCGPDAGRAPVRQAAVKFVPPFLDGERRIPCEIAFLELTQALYPLGAPGAPGRRRRGGFAATDEDNKQHCDSTHEVPHRDRLGHGISWRTTGQDHNVVDRPAAGGRVAGRSQYGL